MHGVRQIFVGPIDKNEIATNTQRNVIYKVCITGESERETEKWRENRRVSASIIKCKSIYKKLFIFIHI